MKPNLLKRLACACLLTSQLLISSTVFARSGGGAIAGGGGDATEERVNEIRSDLLKWINDDGAKDLSLPETLSYGEYVAKMTHILEPQRVVIGFIEKDDDSNVELQVSVNGMPKTCRSFLSIVDSRPHILCSISRFKNTSDSEQYKLIHHEYAGLMNIENNDEAASDYKISSQITDYLTLQTVLRLAVKTKPRDENSEKIKIVLTKNKYIGNRKFEVAFSLSNTENVLQVSLENPNKKNNGIPKVILNKNNNFSFSRVIEVTDLNRYGNDIFYPNVAIQFTDGSLEVLPQVEYMAPRDFFGEGRYEMQTLKNIVKTKVLRKELSMDTAPRSSYSTRKPKIVKNYKIKYEISFDSSAIDLTPFRGIMIYSKRGKLHEFLSDDPVELAKFMDSTKLIKDVLFVQGEKEFFLWWTKLSDHYYAYTNDPADFTYFSIKFIKKGDLLDYEYNTIMLSHDDPTKL